MATAITQEILPPALDATSEPPPIFDGTTRLYIFYICPYAQRVWITRNCKGLQEKIKLVAIDLESRPAWYKEKVYSANKVPALEHNNEVKGESLYLMKYVDINFEGPSLSPTDPTRLKVAEELIDYVDNFVSDVIKAIKGDTAKEIGAPLDFLESALSKFNDGPFLVGQFSMADIAYIPFVERSQPYLKEVKNFDITAGRSKLAEWIEEMNKIEGYKPTKYDPKKIVEQYKKYFGA